MYQEGNGLTPVSVHITSVLYRGCPVPGLLDNPDRFLAHAEAGIIFAGDVAKTTILAYHEFHGNSIATFAGTIINRHTTVQRLLQVGTPCSLPAGKFIQNRSYIMSSRAPDPEKDAGDSLRAGPVITEQPVAGTQGPLQLHPGRFTA